MNDQGDCVQALDRWEDRLENIWEGKPYDILDAALADTVQRFPVHIQPFKDMIGGMRIDLVKGRYRSFDELYEYMYRYTSQMCVEITTLQIVEKIGKMKEGGEAVLCKRSRLSFA